VTPAIWPKNLRQHFSFLIHFRTHNQPPIPPFDDGHRMVGHIGVLDEFLEWHLVPQRHQGLRPGRAVVEAPLLLTHTLEAAFNAPIEDASL
jgi:hypothetical protein